MAIRLPAVGVLGELGQPVHFLGVEFEGGGEVGIPQTAPVIGRRTAVRDRLGHEPTEPAAMAPINETVYHGDRCILIKIANRNPPPGLIVFLPKFCSSFQPYMVQPYMVG